LIEGVMAKVHPIEKAGTTSEPSSCYGTSSGGSIMDNSVFQARWLLIPLACLALSLMALGAIAG
jgi:hypothetical protein